jgi:hypothetical protein
MTVCSYVLKGKQMKTFVSKAFVLGASLGICLSARATQFGLNMDAFYESLTAKPSNENEELNEKEGMNFTGIGFQVMGQALLFEKNTISPYIGLGFGYIPSLKLQKKVTENDVQGNLYTMDVQYENLTYVALEVGPEFAISPVRVQIFVGYYYGLNGKITANFSANIFGNSQVKLQSNSNPLSNFSKAYIGTRLYYPIGYDFDIGVNGNYAFMGKIQQENVTGGSVSTANFSAYDIGISLRRHF